jgi:hypothetical protein
MERLVEPKITEDTVSIEKWVIDLENPLPRTKIGGGFLVESHSTGIPKDGSEDSVSYKVCSTYPTNPGCKICTEREVCPISKFKK